MNYSLQTLLAADQTGIAENLFGFIVSLWLVLGGLIVMLIPAKLLLKWDRRSGYYLYQQELKAAVFYRALGDCASVGGASSFFVCLWYALQ